MTQAVVVDTHVHVMKTFAGFCGRGAVWSASNGEVAFSTGERESVMPASFVDTSFPMEMAERYMREAQVDYCVLMQATFYGLLNEYVSQCCASSSMVLGGCACLDPYAKYWAEILTRCVDELGLCAVKFEMSEDYGLTGLHPDMRLNDSRFDAFWDRLAAAQVPFVLDPGWSGGLGNRPSDIREVLDRHPGLSVVVAHLGQPSEGVARAGAAGLAELGRVPRDVVESDSSWMSWLELGKREGVYFDLAILHRFGRLEEYPYPAAQEFVRIARDSVGPEKLMWASDLPYPLLMATYSQSVDWVRVHCDYLTDGDRSLILGSNAMRVFGQAAGARGKRMADVAGEAT